MKARLAKKEYGYDSGISTKRSEGFNLCSLHGHDFYELDIITGGSVKTVLNGSESVAEVGTIYFLSPEDFHEYTDSGTVDICNIQFFGDSVSSALLRRLLDRKSRIYTPNDTDFENICNIFSVMENTEICHSIDTEIRPRLLEAILLILCGSHSGESRNAEGNNTNMQKAIIYIHEHFKENPSLGEVAAITALNERYFCTKFKEYTGKSFKSYLRSRKLRYARRLVLSTSLPMIDIAEQSGYGTQSHFNREFKEQYGVSPTELRKHLNN